MFIKFTFWDSKDLQTAHYLWKLSDQRLTLKIKEELQIPRQNQNLAKYFSLLLRILHILISHPLIFI